MRFGLLGPLEVRDGAGAVLDPGGPKARQLLAVLLLADGATVATERLVEAIWDGTPPATSHATLHSYVSRLRRLLEPEHDAGRPWQLLVSNSPGYCLEVADDEVDARQFVRLADEGHALLDADEPAKARAVLDRALALWRGPALADFGDLEVAVVAATRLEQRRLSVREDRFETGLRLGAHAALVGELTEAVAQHPLHEGLTEQLAVAFYRCDRPAEALGALDHIRHALHEGPGREMGPRLQDLETRIGAKDRSLDAPARIVVADGSLAGADAVAIGLPGTGADVPLVGRTAELGELRALLSETLGGAHTFALVEGEPGIGKTRLLDEVAGWAAAEGATVVWGRCQVGAGPALGPWLEVLRQLLDSLPPEQRQAVQTPALRQVLDAAGTGPHGLASAAGGRRDAPFALFGALAGVLETVARRGPLVVLIDDLQWADPASAELLEFLAMQPSVAPLLVLGSLGELDAGRDDAVIAAVATLTRRPGTLRLLLTGLDRAATAELVAAVTGPDALLDDVVDEVHRRTAGNPLHVTELARLIVDEGVAAADLPTGVRDVVRRRLALLPDQSPSLLQVAAVAGHEVEVVLLGRATGLPVLEVVGGLEPALTHRLLRPGGRPGTLQFAHAVVRDAVLDGVPPLRLARWHADVADAIEAGGGDPDDLAEIVAGHRVQAVSLGEGDRAAAALERAAGVAVRRCAYAAADDLLDQALALRRASGGTPQALEAELATVGALIALRRSRHGHAFDGRDELFARADELARRLERLELSIGLLWAELAAAATTGDVDVAEPVARQMLALARESDEPAVQMLGHFAWGALCWHSGRMTESREHLRVAVDLLRHGSDEIYQRLPAALVEADPLIRGFYGMVVVLTGDAERAARRFAGLRLDYELPAQLLAVQVFEGVAAAAVGDVTAAARAGAAAHAIDPAGQTPFLGVAGQVLWGWARVEQGATAEGLALLEEALPRLRNSGLRLGLGFARALWGRALLVAGRPEEASEVVVAAESKMDPSGERWSAAVLQVVQAQVEHALGAPDDTVVDLLLEARGTAIGQGQTGLVRRVERAARELGIALS